MTTDTSAPKAVGIQSPAPRNRITLSRVLRNGPSFLLALSRAFCPLLSAEWREKYWKQVAKSGSQTTVWQLC